MIKCCICGKELTSPVLWACSTCVRHYELGLLERDWPAWARSELERERRRRRFDSPRGPGANLLSYAPYSRMGENQTYRKVNGVHKDASALRKRAPADDLFYSTGEQDDGRNYAGLIEDLPPELREKLNQRAELYVMLDDALHSLPVISQRALRGWIDGLSIDELAAVEGVRPDTMQWLLDEARRRLVDLLEERLGADSGLRLY